MLIKLLVNAEDGKLLGAQIVGRAGVDKRIDVLAVALHAGMTAMDLEELELAYAPPYGAAKDPVNVAGFVAANAVRGDVEQAFAEELDEARRGELTSELFTDRAGGGAGVPPANVCGRGARATRPPSHARNSGSVSDPSYRAGECDCPATSAPALSPGLAPSVTLTYSPAAPDSDQRET